MQPVDPRVVELLNDALTLELTVVNTYFLNAKMLDNWGLPGLAKPFRDFSMGEMKDAEALMERILMLDGHPNVQKLLPITIGENAKEMLELALASELAAVKQFNEAATVCLEVGDHGSHALFQEMVTDEEGHADWFEGVLDAIETVGLENWLAQQVQRGE